MTPQGGRPIAGKTFSEDLTAELEELMNGGQKAFAPPVAVSSLSSTQMMPFMDANIDVGENMIYCPTFALAWSKYKTLITQQAETEFGKRISDVPFTPDDINSAAVTIMAGSLSADDLAAVNSKLPPMPMGGPVAYCQLKKQLPFIAEFEPFANPLTFATATGNIDVRSFGVTSGWDQWGKALGQIQVLDYRSPDDFIIRIGNLPGESLVLAKMPKPATIAEGIRAMEAKIASTNVEGDAVGVVSGEQVVIPILEFSLMEDFTERLQHSAQPAGSRLLAATQLIQFRLDETGAVLFSEAAVIGENGHYEYKVGERTFIFDKPFLLVLQQTTKTNPYFAAWVANGDVMAVVGAATE